MALRSGVRPLAGLDYYGPMTRFHRLLVPAIVAGMACFSGAQARAQEPAVPNSAMDSTIFYEVLVGELSAGNGDPGSAYQLLLDAARKTGEGQLYERAITVALQARAGDSALLAAQAWLRSAPASQAANRYVLQILLGLNRLNEAAEPLKRSLAALNPDARKAAIEEIPGTFGRVSDKKAAARLVEQVLAPDLGNKATGVAAWTAVGTLRLMGSDMAGALDAARNGAALSAQASEPVQLALALLESGYAPAEELVQQQLTDASPPALRMVYVRVLIDQQKFAQARAQIDQLIRNQPDYANAWLVRGSLEFQDHQLPQARSSLEKYLSLAANPTEASEPGASQANILLSQIAEQDGKPQEALAYLDRISRPQDMVRAQMRRATLMAHQGKLDEARALIHDTPELQPEDARTKISTEVQLLRDAQQYQAAYDTLQRSSNRFAMDPDYLYDLAMAAEKLDKVAEMETLLRKVIALRPDYHNAYNALGYSLADRNMRLPEARALVLKALEFAPDDPFIVDSLAWVEFRSGNLDKAQSLLESAYARQPDPEIAAHLGEVLWNSQQRERAQSIWQEALRRSPDNLTLRETLKRLTPL
jgi:tetratricopeptide (TPR) repeat protein